MRGSYEADVSVSKVSSTDCITKNHQMSTQSTIQIYGRVRPLRKNSKLKQTTDSSRYNIDHDQDMPSITFHVPKDIGQGLVNHQKEAFEFGFNRMFDVDATQEEIFDVVAKPVVER